MFSKRGENGPTAYIIEKVWRIFKDDNSWSQEAKSNNGIDIVIAKNFPKWGKVFRLSVRKKN